MQRNADPAWSQQRQQQGATWIIELLVVNLSCVAITRGNMRHGHQGPGSGQGQQITFREQSEDSDIIMCECV